MRHAVDCSCTAQLPGRSVGKLHEHNLLLADLCEVLHAVHCYGVAHVHGRSAGKVHEHKLMQAKLCTLCHLVPCLVSVPGLLP